MGKTYKESYIDSKQAKEALKRASKKKIRHQKMEAYKRTKNYSYETN